MTEQMNLDITYSVSWSFEILVFIDELSKAVPICVMAIKTYFESEIGVAATATGLFG